MPASKMITAGVCLGASRGALVVKNLPASAGDIRDVGSIPRSGRSLERENSHPL